MKTLPAHKIIKTAALIPYANNSRTHSAKQIDQIAASIREFGFTNPILINDEYTIIAGHGRVLAAQKLKLAEVPCMVISGLSETQQKALVLADNRLALSAGWDTELLQLEIQSLMESGYNIDVMGFDEEELNKLMQPMVAEGETDPDETPELKADPITVLGDTWLLGKHRIRCGDSTSATDVEALLNGVQPHLMVTDPPYGVEYDAAWRNEAARTSEGMGNRALGAGAVGKVLNDDKCDWSEAWALFPGNVAYIWHAGKMAGVVQASLEQNGFEIRSQIIWAKSNFAISRGDYHWQHEPCWYAVKTKGGKNGHWLGDRKQTTLWEIAKPAKSETGHSTQKPVECMKRPIENNSSVGQAVYEPFSGSGTTIIAGEMTNRSIYAMELNPAYVDMAVERWQNFTGKKATLESTGEVYGGRTETADTGSAPPKAGGNTDVKKKAVSKRAKKNNPA